MKKRILAPELMDDPALDEMRLQDALADVSFVNKWLGGQKITLDGLDYFFNKYPQNQYSIADLGCGDGEMLRKMADYCRKKGIKATFLGLDLNSKSVALAIDQSQEYPEIAYRQKNILELDTTEARLDIITTTLTMHHFTDNEIVGFLKCFGQLSRLGWVVNDLHRSSIASVLFRAFSSIFMNTYIARYDGLVSIKRAFTKKELTTFAAQLGLTEYKIGWRWAFRYLWITDMKAQK